MTAGILDPSPATSGAELNTTERDLIARIDGESKNAHTVAKVAAVLGASLFVYRMYMRRRLKEEMKTVAPEKLPVVAGAVFGSFLPGWVNALAPAVLAGYLEGQAAVRQGKVPEHYLHDVAEAYAKQLGEHMNDVSYDAMMQGFHAQVNRRVPARRAVENVIEAYGVPPRVMNSLVKIWTGEDTKILTNRPAKSKRDAKAASLIDKAFKGRAKLFGETEAWTTRSAAKQLVWMYGIRNGTIPADATRVWRTARDERVCPACGPLDKAEVPIHEPFITDSGTYWSPPLHPKCRCDIDLAVGLELAELAAPSKIGKALGDDPFDRDRRGRFAHRESRLATAVARPDFEPEPEETPEEAWERIKAKRAAQKKQKAKITPVKLGGAKLSGAKLQGASLQPVDVKPAEATPAEGKKSKKKKKVKRLQAKAKLAYEKDHKAKLGPDPTLSVAFKPITIPDFDIPREEDDHGLVRLPKPVWGLKYQEELGQDILTGPSDRVYEREELDDALKEYWKEIIEDDVTDEFTHQYGLDKGMVDFSTPDNPDTIFYIDEKTYRNVWYAMVSGRKGAEQEEFKIYSEDASKDYEENPEDFEDWELDDQMMTASEIAYYTGIGTTIERRKPVVFKMRVGTIGETDTQPGRAQANRTNPGRWQVQGDYWDLPDHSFKPYMEVPVTPIPEGKNPYGV